MNTIASIARGIYLVFDIIVRENFGLYFKGIFGVNNYLYFRYLSTLDASLQYLLALTFTFSIYPLQYLFAYSTLEKHIYTKKLFD